MQLLGGALASLLAAVLAFGLFDTLGNTFLDHTVYGDSFSQKISKRKFSQLQNYVLEEKITPKNLNRLNAWCSRGSKVYLTLYSGTDLIYESPVSKSKNLNADDFDPQYEDRELEYSLSFSNGIRAQAFLYYYAGDSFYFWMVGVSGLLSFAVFSLCFITLIRRKLTYIQQLKNELDILASGDLTYKVTIRGHDELGALASGIDDMRRSILNHQQTEEAIRSANSRLVTAMSHDLRNPLTSLTAYLELLDMNKVQDEAQRRHLIRQSLTQAVSIRTLADKLFEYFLVYASEWEQPELKPFEADDIMSQFWQEYAFALESHGFTVETDFRKLDGKLMVNVDLLRRAFDNLYANIVKYGETASPVRIRYRREKDRFILILENEVISGRDRIEGTNIGLNTSRRILEMHEGSFEASERDTLFEVRLSLPFISG